MKGLPMNSWIVASLVVVLYFSTIKWDRRAEASETDLDVPAKLSIRQTIAICYTLPRERFVVSANSEAAEHLRSIISQSKNTNAPAYALNVLGAIGNEEDLKWCVKMLQAELQKPVPNLRLVDNAFDSLGRFAKRDIGQSREMLEQMASVEYWRDRRFDAFRAASGNSRRFEEYTVPQAIYALAAAGLPGADTLAHKAVDEYPEGDVAEWARGRLRVETIKGHEAALSKAANEEITQEDRLALDRVYSNIDQTESERLELPTVERASAVPVDPADAADRAKPRELSDQEKENLTKEAREAYQEMPAIIDLRMDLLSETVSYFEILDNVP
jgi:hypothetical protein